MTYNKTFRSEITWTRSTLRPTDPKMRRPWAQLLSSTTVNKSVPFGKKTLRFTYFRRMKS